MTLCFVFSGETSGGTKKIQSLEDRVRVTKTKIMYNLYQIF